MSNLGVDLDSVSILFCHRPYLINFPPQNPTFTRRKMTSSLNPSMDDLPVNITVDILSRLPAKTIIHCKCVCKQWLNLILDSYFINLHLSRSPPGLIIHHRSEALRTNYMNPGILKPVEIENEPDHHRFHHDPTMSLNLNLEPIFEKSQILLVGSVNGLVCLWQDGNENDDTYICNPTTREYMILPRQHFYKRNYSAIIAYGFGVCLQTVRYKVVRILQVNLRPNQQQSSWPSLVEAEVYTLGTGRWRRVGQFPYLLDEYCGLFLNGRVHWNVVDEGFLEKIYGFDFEDETFHLVPSSPGGTGGERTEISFQNLGVLNGCLCQSYTYASEFVIWVMKEYGIKKSWVKDVVIKPNVYSLDWREPVHLIKGLKDGTILMIYCGDVLLAYCAETKTMVDTGIFDRYLSAMVYVPSFLKLQNFESERVFVF